MQSSIFHQFKLRQAVPQGLPLHLATVPALLLALVLSGCSTLDARSMYKARSRKKSPAQPAAIQPQMVGKVLQIDPAYGFAIVDAGLNPSLAAGEQIESRSGGEMDGEITSKLRVSGETLRPFFIADILEGRPEKGDIVTRTPPPQTSE